VQGQEPVLLLAPEREQPWGRERARLSLSLQAQKLRRLLPLQLHKLCR
jgi:hypothetical protein